jgi:endo-1,4-beta-D-glucanase Y
MMHDSDPQKARMLARLKPMETMTAKQGVPPERVNVATGKAQGNGPVGFSAALLPFLQDRDAQAAQRQRVADHFPGKDAYYSYVLTLFGQGWDEHRFRFTLAVSYNLTGASNAQVHIKFIVFHARHLSDAFRAGGTDRATTTA